MSTVGNGSGSTIGVGPSGSTTTLRVADRADDRKVDWCCGEKALPVDISRAAATSMVEDVMLMMFVSVLF